MANTFGFGTDTSGFSDTLHDAIQKSVIATLRAGLVSLPKGAVVPAVIVNQSGENFTLRSTSYPDLVDTTPTDPLTEGVAPGALKLGIDTQDWTVTQSGARTVITDIAELQSPHPLKQIAAEKIARLAAEKIDAIGRAALALVSTTNDYGQTLSTDILLDMVATAQGSNFVPVQGAGFYAVMHPFALRGLLNEDGLNGYVNVMAETTNGGSLTAGAVGQYRGVTFLVSSKFVDTAGVFPVYLFGKDSIAAGDLGSMQYIGWNQPGVGNELGQLSGVGFKGILGAAVLSFSNTTDGAGGNAAAVQRVLRFGVNDGRTNQ